MQFRKRFTKRERELACESCGEKVPWPQVWCRHFAMAYFDKEKALELISLKAGGFWRMDSLEPVHCFGTPTCSHVVPTWIHGDSYLVPQWHWHSVITIRVFFFFLCVIFRKKMDYGFQQLLFTSVCARVCVCCWDKGSCFANPKEKKKIIHRHKFCLLHDLVHAWVFFFSFFFLYLCFSIRIKYRWKRDTCRNNSATRHAFYLWLCRCSWECDHIMCPVFLIEMLIHTIIIFVMKILGLKKISDL